MNEKFKDLGLGVVFKCKDQPHIYLVVELSGPTRRAAINLTHYTEAVFGDEVECEVLNRELPNPCPTR